MGKLSKAWKAITSPFKAAKKFVKNIKKPFSKITKGIARGIAKMAKIVMKGVGQLNKKLGPIGMLGLAIAMPYAMQGLGAGFAKMSASQGPFGTFLKAVGQRGSQIMQGFNRATGFVKEGFSNITKGIMDTFSGFSNRASQSNIWKSISNGAKRLYTNAKKYTPKFRAGKAGTVDVGNWGGHPLYGGGSQTMTTTQAQGLFQSGAIDASQLSNQTLGSAEGWFTKAGSSDADKLVTETINSAMKDNVNLLQGDSQRYFNDLVTHQKSVGSYVNDSQAFDSVINNSGTKYNGLTDWDGYYSTDLASTGDYTHHLGKARDSGISTYEFHGGKTFDNSIGKSSIKKASNLKKNAKYAAGTMAKSLLSQDSAYKLPEVMYASTADMTQTTTGGYGGTEIEGSWGGSLLKGAFNDDQRERIMNFYKNMNIVGSH